MRTAEHAHLKGNVDRDPSMHRETVALLPWANVIEDFLELIGISLDEFCDQFRGSWMFGYVEALSAVGIHTQLVCISSRATDTIRRTHKPTGASIVILPASPAYRLLRRGGFPRRALGAGLAVRQVAPYLSTPLLLLGRELRRSSCAALLCQEYEWPRFDECVLLGRLIGIPVFGVFQGRDYRRWRLERLTRPLALKASAGLIVPTEAERRRLQTQYRIDGGRLATIFNPLDLEVWRRGDRTAGRARLGIPMAAKVVVWHGRVSIWKKGLDVLLAAWQRVCRESEGRDIYLVLMGSGEGNEELRARIDGDRVERVVWLDRMLHDTTLMCEVLSAGDVYVFPSRKEGFPVALMEALACDLPAVSTDVSGAAEIVGTDQGAAGVIVPTEDPEELAHAVFRLLHDDQLRSVYAGRARRRAEDHFSLEHTGRALRAFLLGERRLPPDLPAGLE